MDTQCYFNVFSSCFLTKGANRSCIYDFSRRIFKTIPNSLFEIIQKHNGSKISSILKLYPDDNLVIKSYFKFLRENEFCFFTQRKVVELFPPVELKYKSESQIANCVIGIDRNSGFDIRALGKELSELGTKFIQIRLFFQFKIHEIKSFATSLCNLGFRSIEILVPYNSKILESDYITLANGVNEIGLILIYNAPSNDVIQIGDLNMKVIVNEKRNIWENERSKILNSSFFSLSQKLFFESQIHNPYFNQKIAISTQGHIKNALFIDDNFGFIGKTPIKEVLKNDKFTRLWDISKDKVDICKDCEFRYVCCDNRVPIKVNNIWRQTEVCNYNPYDSKWTGL